MNQEEDVFEAVQAIKSHIHFDVDVGISMFEVNIRALGGLVSSHNLIVGHPSLAEEYNGELLAIAVDLADRLLPAFDTVTGIPHTWINLEQVNKYTLHYSNAIPHSEIFSSHFCSPVCAHSLLCQTIYTLCFWAGN